MFRRKLDYLAIPGGSKGKLKRERMKRAMKELNGRDVGKIIFLKGKDSEEDILYLGKIIQKGERIGFDTFPLHYEEYKELIRKAKRDGKFPKGVKTENIETPQNFRLTIYGILGLSEEKIKKRELNFVKDRDDKFWIRVKKFIKRLLGFT